MLEKNASQGQEAADGTPRRRRSTRKVLMSLGALGAAATIAGLATFATFTSTTTAVTSTITSGTVTIALGATGASTNRLNIGATLLAAGDSVQRSVDLTNSGDLPLASVLLATSASPSNLLTTDTTHGLQMVIDECSAAWTETGTSAPFTYACTGPATSQTLVASTPVVNAATDLSLLHSLAALAVNGTDHLRVTLTLPQAADNTFEGLSSTISYVFTGTQRNATAK
ncbi:MAG TPA: TasA family protein [Actinomycetota bacterium]|nr:TasA family protein [Actinomycetota bacterium]